MSVTITIDAHSVARAAGILDGAAVDVQRALDGLVRHRLSAAESDFRAHTPRSVPPPGAPGATAPPMADLWRTSMDGPASGAVGNLASYTDFLFEPTAAHEIRPVHAPALHFFAAGNEVFSRLVHHPGTQPSAPLVDALARQVGAAEAELGALGVTVTTKLAGAIHQ